MHFISWNVALVTVVLIQYGSCMGKQREPLSIKTIINYDWEQ